MYRPMKFTWLVPSISRPAIQALLSPSRETWQSVHCFVSFARTVCGTCVLNALPVNPADEIVGAWLMTQPRVPFCTLSVTALDERTGATLWPSTVPSIPSMYPSVRRISGLYDAYTCDSSPSLCSIGFFVFTFAARWHPKQFVVHDEWQL